MTALVTESLVVHLIHQMYAQLGIMVTQLPSGHEIRKQSGHEIRKQSRSDGSGNRFVTNKGLKLSHQMT